LDKVHINFMVEEFRIFIARRPFGKLSCVGNKMLQASAYLFFLVMMKTLKTPISNNS